MKRLIFCAIVALTSISYRSYGQQEDLPIVVQNLYYPKPGKEDEVYGWRLHASDVRVKAGLPAGRVLKKVSGDASYYVIWECDYPSMAAREADVNALGNSEEFTKVQEHMSTLIQKFERNIWELNIRPGNDEIEIGENRFASNAAIKAHDTASIARHWDRNVIVITSLNAQLIGKKRNAEAFSNEFKKKKDVVYVRSPIKIEVFQFANMAAETGTWVGQWKDSNDIIEVTGTYYAKWKKSGDKWLILAEIYTPLTCNNDRYCEALFK